MSKKALRKLASFSEDLCLTKNKKISKNKKKKNKPLAIEVAKKSLESKANIIDENVKKLLLLSGKRFDDETSKTVLKKVTGKKQRYIEEKPKEESTVFTEEDFTNFEKEYHFD